MKTSRIHPGAEVKCDVLGRVFPAIVTGKPAGGRVPVEPQAANVTYLTVRARQIKEILRPATRSGQTQLGGLE